jgi:hypothetical protein
MASLACKYDNLFITVIRGCEDSLLVLEGVK